MIYIYIKISSRYNSGFFEGENMKKSAILGACAVIILLFSGCESMEEKKARLEQISTLQNEIEICQNKVKISENNIKESNGRLSRMTDDYYKKTIEDNIKTHQQSLEKALQCAKEKTAELKKLQ
jgi:outer membrane murein-binding lipoprotein Lpp